MMPIPNNLQTLQSNITTDYFNNFYTPKYTVSQNIDDTIIAYFEEVTGSTEAARAVAGSVIYTSKSQGLDPMETLREFMSLPKGQLNNYLTMFLNLNRVGTSLLGVSNAPLPSKYITRTILA